MAALSTINLPAAYNKTDNAGGVIRVCSKGKCLGMSFAAFGAGLLISLCFPTKFMLFVLAVALIILGIIVSK